MPALLEVFVEAARDGSGDHVVARTWADSVADWRR